MEAIKKILVIVALGTLFMLFAALFAASIFDSHEKKTSPDSYYQNDSTKTDMIHSEDLYVWIWL